MAEAARTNVVEEYGRSLTAMRHVGNLIVEGSVTVEEIREETELYHEFRTAVKEMLKNDPEFHGSLELSNRREHQVINGQAVNANGEPMVDVLQNAVVASKLLAEEDPDYDHQVVRDECDVKLAIRVDDMPPGTTLWGVSKEPTKALKKRPDIYHKRFGYKDGLIYVQTYSKTHKETVITGSYSVKYKHIGLLKGLLAECGMVIPDDESDDTWLNHALLTDMTSEQADIFARELRREHNLAEKEGDEIISVDEFMDKHEATAQTIFDKYYPAIAESTSTHQNSEILINLAKTIMDGQTNNLRPEIRQQLIVLRNSNNFNDESAKVLDSILRYATVEELRKRLFKPKHLPEKANPSFTIGLSHQIRQLPDMNTLIASNVYSGVAAGRSYPGCPGNIQLGNDNNEANDKDADGINRQEAYGGKEDSDADCEFVSKSCPECGAKNVRTIVKKISSTKKRIEGACGCIKVYKK